MDNILQNLKTTQILRISCSDIAAVTGFHPWTKLDEVFEKYLYQDLDQLMIQDAENLDTEFLSAEEEVQRILQKIDVDQKLQLEALDTATKDSKILNTNSKAEDMLKQVQELMKNSGVLNKISSSELKYVENEFKARVRKNYGINCEHKSLDKYEDIIGFPVVDRNLDILKLKVMPLEDDHMPYSKGLVQVTDTEVGDEDEPAANVFSLLINNSKRLSKEQAAVAQLGGVKKRRRTVPKPSFVLIGRVDGVSHQLDLRSEDPAQWSKTLRVVVEMKSRVNRISSPPPLYEQIQLVSYMIILGCHCGDLVQAVAKDSQNPGSRSIVETATTTVVETSVDVHSSATVKEEGTRECCAEVQQQQLQCSELTDTATPPSSSGTTTASCSGGSSSSSEEASISAAEFLCTASSSSSTSSSTIHCTTTTKKVSNTSSSSCSSSSTITHINTSTVHPLAVQSSMQTSAPSISHSCSGSSLPSTTTTTTPATITTAPATATAAPVRARRYDPTELYSEEAFHVSRIHLDGPPFYHRRYWDTVVMPRLRVFRDAVAVMRCDDALRYAYLMSTPEAKLQILQNLCPYFD